MNDTYVEQLVARKKSPLANVVKFVLIGFAVAFIAFALLVGGGFLFFFIGAILGATAYFTAPLFDVEYEYLYLSKEISIDTIYGKERRKHTVTIDLNKAEVIAPSNSHELDSYKSRNHTDKDFTSGNDDVKTYTIVDADGENTTLYKVELNQEMINAIKMVFPRKVMEY